MTLWRRKSAQKVLFSTVALLVAFWATAAAWAFAQRQQAIDNHFQALKQLNSAIAEHFSGLLQLTEMALDAARNELMAREQGDEISHAHLYALAHSLRTKTDEMVDLAVAHADGTVELTRPNRSASPINIRDRDYFAAQMAGSPTGLFFGELTRARTDGSWVVPITIVPSAAKSGAFPFAVIRIKSLAALHEQQRMSTGGAIGIVKTDGRVLSRTPLDERLPTMSFAGLPEFQTVWLQEERGVYVAPRGLKDNKPRLLSFHLLKPYGLFVYISTEQEQVLAPWRQRVIVVAAGLTLVTVTLLIGAFLLIRSLERIEVSHRRFADIAEIASDLIFETDTDLRITYVSERSDEIFGLDHDHIIGKRPRQLGWAPIDHETGIRLSLAVENRQAFSELQFRRGTDDPADRVVALAGRPLFDDHERFLGFRCVAMDITERVQQQRERELRAERDAQTSKLEALGQLAGGIAHDFNNLLGAILGFAHFLVQDTAPDTQQRGYAERIVAAGQRGRALVQQILTFSRRSPGDPTDLKVADVVQETCELLRATIPLTSRLMVENDGDDLIVSCDRSQFGQVLVNLCINASDALEGAPGEIRLSVAPLDPDRPELARLPNCVIKPTPAAQATWCDDEGYDWVATGGLTSRDNICIRVSDTGSGIPREHLAPLFDLFFTTKASGGGTGLGLPVVQRVVTGHGGALLVRTKAGIGTTFEVILPRSEASGLPSEPNKQAPEHPNHHSATILVIDDDVDFCDMVETALRRLGHEVVSVHDPLEGLAAIQEDPSLWNLVVTDQSMPGIKGSDLVRRIKQVRPVIRCVICTGYSSSLNEPAALAAGADGYRTKPLDIDDFAALVARLLASGD